MRIAISDFGALAPAIGSHALPDNMAVVADNVDLRYRYLRPFHFPGVAAATILSTDKRAFSLIGDDLSDKWIGFTSIDADFSKGPVINDTYERYYWSTPGSYLRVGAYASIDPSESTMVLGTDYFKAGVPAPRTGASVVAVGGAAPNEDRYYTYTFINNFGEEGAPAPPFSVTGPINATSWNISGMDVGTGPTHPDFAGRSIISKRIYRTLPGVSGTTVFYAITDIPLANATYSDTSVDALVAANNILESTYWSLPPAVVDGFVLSDNGFIITWNGRDLYISEVYRPHAYPPQYQRSTEYPIVGIGVFGGHMFLCTTGAPYLLSGTSPGTLTLTKFDTTEPCLFKRSVVTMSFGVMYASPNGLVLLSTEGTKVLTSELLTAPQWQEYLQSSLIACRFHDRYLAFYSSSRGLVFDPRESTRGFTTMTTVSGVQGLEADIHSGQVHVLQGTEVLPFSDITAPRAVYTWISKVFNLGSAENMGVLQFDLEVGQIDASSSFALTADQITFNAFLANPATPYNEAFGAGVFGKYYEPPSNPVGPSNILPFGGSQHYRSQYAGVPNGFLLCTVYADDVEVGTYDVLNMETIKIASGQKRQDWQIKLVGNVYVYEAKLATSTKEMRLI